MRFRRAQFGYPDRKFPVEKRRNSRGGGVDTPRHSPEHRAFHSRRLSLNLAQEANMTSASDMERARTAMMVAAGVVTSTGLLVLTQRSIRSTIASMLKVRISRRE